MHLVLLRKEEKISKPSEDKTTVYYTVYSINLFIKPILLSLR